MDRRTCILGEVYSGQTFWAGLKYGCVCAPPDYTDRPTWEQYRYNAWAAGC